MSLISPLSPVTYLAKGGTSFKHSQLQCVICAVFQNGFIINRLQYFHQNILQGCKQMTFELLKLMEHCILFIILPNQMIVSVLDTHTQKRISKQITVVILRDPNFQYRRKCWIWQQTNGEIQ